MRLSTIIFLSLCLFFVSSCGVNVATVGVSPGSATLAAGETQQFTAYGRTSSGSLVSISATWSTAGDIGSISSAGLFTASALGDGYVYATYNGIVGSASVTVTDQGGISGTVRNSSGTALSGITVFLVEQTSKSTSTSSSGTYSLSGIDAGNYHVEARGTLAYLTTTHEVTVSEGATTTQNFSMADRVGILAQTISQSGASISITGSAVNNGSSTVTSVTVAYIFYNSADLPIGTGSASLGDMTAGETKTFSVFLTLSEDTYSRYSVTATGTGF